MTIIHDIKPYQHMGMCILSVTIHGIEVDITASYTEPHQYDCFVYFCGRGTSYVPTTHLSKELAIEYATTFIDSFQSQGGLRAYKQRIMDYYNDYRFTRF